MLAKAINNEPEEKDKKKADSGNICYAEAGHVHGYLLYTEIK